MSTDSRQTATCTDRQSNQSIPCCARGNKHFHSNELQNFLPPHTFCNRYTMMLNCWDDDPEKRPHFFQVVTTLSDMLQTVSGYLNLNQCQVEESLPPLLPATDPTDPPTPMMEAPPSLSSPGEQDSDSKLAS